MAKKRKRLTRHHICPRSRMSELGVKANELNIVRWDDDFHRAYHQLFGPMTPDEAINLIRVMTIPGYRWSAVDIENQKALIMSNARLIVGRRNDGDTS